MYIYLNGIGKVGTWVVVGFIGEVESSSGEFGDTKINCGICGGG